MTVFQSVFFFIFLHLRPCSAVYPGNFALNFDPSHGDVVRVPHESSMQGPLIDSFTVELWLLVQPRSQAAPTEGRVVNLVGFPGRHPFVGLASDTGCACVQLKLSNGSWYSYEGTTPIDDGEWHHVSTAAPHFIRASFLAFLAFLASCLPRRVPATHLDHSHPPHRFTAVRAV